MASSVRATGLTGSTREDLIEVNRATACRLPPVRSLSPAVELPPSDGCCHLNAVGLNGNPAGSNGYPLGATCCDNDYSASCARPVRPGRR